MTTGENLASKCGSYCWPDPYYCNGTSIPVAFELVKKPIHYSDIATQKLRRRSNVTKNELMCEMIASCVGNALKYRFVVMDSWFASIAALKDNRLVALSEEDRNKKRFVRVDELDSPDHTAVRVWLKESANAVLLIRQVFKNKDDSTGTCIWFAAI